MGQPKQAGTLTKRNLRPPTAKCRPTTHKGSPRSLDADRLQDEDQRRIAIQHDGLHGSLVTRPKSRSRAPGARSSNVATVHRAVRHRRYSLAGTAAGRGLQPGEGWPRRPGRDMRRHPAWNCSHFTPTTLPWTCNRQQRRKSPASRSAICPRVRRAHAARSAYNGSQADSRWSPPTAGRRTGAAPG